MISLYSKLRQVRSQQSLLNFEDTDFDCGPIDEDYEDRSPTPVLKVIECRRKEEPPKELRIEQCGPEQLLEKLRNWQGIAYTIGQDLTPETSEIMVAEELYSQSVSATYQSSNYGRSDDDISRDYSQCGGSLIVASLPKSCSRITFYRCRKMDGPNYVTAKESYVPDCVIPVEYCPGSITDISLCCASMASIPSIKQPTRKRSRVFYVQPSHNNNKMFTHCGSLQYQQSLFQRCVLGGIRTGIPVYK